MVVFFSGSGLSAASGVPTFRGHGGLYEGLRAEEVLSVDGYRRHPERVEGMLDRMAYATAEAEPNRAHEGIAEWERRHPDTCVITQNVDDLLERAGCRRVVHLHGELALHRCRRDPAHRQVAERPWSDQIRCGKCGSRVRSDVVLFGERASFYQVLYDELDRLTWKDTLVVIGTSGYVVPIGDLMMERVGQGFQAVLVNLEESELLPEHLFDEVVYKSAPEAWPQVERILESKLERVALAEAKGYKGWGLRVSHEDNCYKDDA